MGTNSRKSSLNTAKNSEPPVRERGAHAHPTVGQDEKGSRFAIRLFRGGPGLLEAAHADHLPRFFEPLSIATQPAIHEVLGPT